LYESGYTIYERFDFYYIHTLPHFFRSINKEKLSTFATQALHEKFGTEKYKTSIVIQKFIDEVKLSHSSHYLALILKEIFEYFIEDPDDFTLLSSMRYERGSYTNVKRKV
jgi:hypothetical protein